MAHGTRCVKLIQNGLLAWPHYSSNLPFRNSAICHSSEYQLYFALSYGLWLDNNLARISECIEERSKAF